MWLAYCGQENFCCGGNGSALNQSWCLQTLRVEQDLEMGLENLGVGTANTELLAEVHICNLSRKAITFRTPQRLKPLLQWESRIAPSQNPVGK